MSRLSSASDPQISRDLTPKKVLYAKSAPMSDRSWQGSRLSLGLDPQISRDKTDKTLVKQPPQVNEHNLFLFLFGSYLENLPFSIVYYKQFSLLHKCYVYYITIFCFLVFIPTSAFSKHFKLPLVRGATEKTNLAPMLDLYGFPDRTSTH